MKQTHVRHVFGILTHSKCVARLLIIGYRSICSDTLVRSGSESMCQESASHFHPPCFFCYALLPHKSCPGFTFHLTRKLRAPSKLAFVWLWESSHVTATKKTSVPYIMQKPCKLALISDLRKYCLDSLVRVECLKTT
jgi:hypothetical protein